MIRSVPKQETSFSRRSFVGGSDARARDIALDLLDTFDLQPVTELIRWS